MCQETPTKSRFQEQPRPLQYPGLKPSLFAATSKRSGLLIANHTAKTTPAWALNPGMGKVKVVSVYFALQRKLESDQIGLMEEDSLLLQERSAVEEAGHQGSLCPLGSEEWRLDAAASRLWDAPFKAEARGAKSHHACSSSSGVCLSCEWVTGTDLLSPASLK